MSKYQSWGNIPKAQQDIVKLNWRNETIDFNHAENTYLPYGLGRSYGDSCLNDGGVLCVTSGLDHFIQFDAERGIIRCEAGVSLADILDLVVPYGWFLPVTPGTKFVTIAGALANDVHGKNHHSAGTFGCHVSQFELLRSNNETLVCSSSQNAELFQATIGGLGLTGLVNWVELRLKKIPGPRLLSETIRFANLAEFFELSEESDKEWEYTVSWVDCLATGDSLGRGLFIRGTHTDQDVSPCKKKKIISVPFNMPGMILNRYSVTAFNTAYYHKSRNTVDTSVTCYDPFFYPLDRILNWNRMYGRRGFYQYQCVVPLEDGAGVMGQILKTIAKSKLGSFLSVLKKFGDIASPGILSFPRKGVTLALDFANQGKKTRQLLDDLDKIVVEANGAVYPAKDARMSAQSFKHYYPQWHSFMEYIDPKFSSSFWRRVTEENK